MKSYILLDNMNMYIYNYIYRQLLYVIMYPELQTVLYHFLVVIGSSSLKWLQQTNIFDVSGHLPTNLPSRNQP